MQILYYGPENNINVYFTDHTVCMTVHRFDKNTGNSIQVDKMCSVPELCTLDHVGCHDKEQNNEVVSIKYCYE